VKKKPYARPELRELPLSDPRVLDLRDEVRERERARKQRLEQAAER
jgi:hypothetical protein